MWLITGVPSTVMAVVLGGVLFCFGPRLPTPFRSILAVRAGVFSCAAVYAFITWRQGNETVTRAFTSIMKGRKAAIWDHFREIECFRTS